MNGHAESLPMLPESKWTPTEPGSWRPHFRDHDEAVEAMNKWSRRRLIYGGPLHGKPHGWCWWETIHVRRACWAAYRVCDCGPALYVGCATSKQKARELAKAFPLPPKLPPIRKEDHVGTRYLYRDDLHIGDDEFSLEVQSSEQLSWLFRDALRSRDGVATAIGGAIRVVHTNRLKLKHFGAGQRNQPEPAA